MTTTETTASASPRPRWATWKGHGHAASGLFHYGRRDIIHREYAPIRVTITVETGRWGSQVIVRDQDGSPVTSINPAKKFWLTKD